jgi:hypothetical protein
MTMAESPAIIMRAIEKQRPGGKPMLNMHLMLAIPSVSSPAPASDPVINECDETDALATIIAVLDTGCPLSRA